MIPEEVFKRRHHGTPQSFSLIIANTIVIALIAPTFISCGHISIVFWIGLALLALYNFYTIRRNREDFNNAAIIAYAISVVIIIGVVILLATKGC